MLQDCFSKLTFREDNYVVQGPRSVCVVRDLVNKTPEEGDSPGVKVYEVENGRRSSQNHRSQNHLETQNYKNHKKSQEMNEHEDFKTISRKNSLRNSSNGLPNLVGNYPPHRLPSVVERFMQESLTSADFRNCKVLEATEPSLLDQHMAAIGMDEFEQFFDRDQKRESAKDFYRNEIYKKETGKKCKINECSSDSDSMMVRETRGRDNVRETARDKSREKVREKALSTRSRQPSPISSDYSDKSEVGSRDLELLAQWSREYGEHIATKMLGTLMSMRDKCSQVY